jgi:hypothetical protein
VELEVRPPLAAPGREALARALSAAGALADGQPAGHGASWRQAGLREATESADDLRALAAEDAGRNARVVEP